MVLIPPLEASVTDVAAIDAIVCPATPPIVALIVSPTTTPGGATTKIVENPTGESEVTVPFAVPTPMTEKGEFDISILNSTITKLPAGKIVIIKSTIIPSSAEGLIESFPQQNLIFNPEFLTERTAVEDFQKPSRIVIGGDSKASVGKVKDIYRKVFPSRLIEILETDAKTACFIKYFSNCFFAAKVSLMNEFKQIAEKHNISWETAVDGLLLSGWVNPMHTQVPGPDGQLGFGGKCFPKDISAFIKYSETLGVDPKVLKAAWEKNLEVRKDLDWHRIKGAVSKKNLTSNE